MKNIKLKTYKNEEYISSNNDIINFSVSNNVVNTEIFEIIQNSKIITRGPLPARIFELNKSIYDNIFEFNLTNKDLIKDNNIFDLNLKNEENMLDISSEKLGQYSQNKKFKLIKGQGELRETLACLQMLAREQDLPYRADSIEKILRDSLSRGKKPTLQLLGGITSMMGLHSTIVKVNSSQASRTISKVGG